MAELISTDKVQSLRLRPTGYEDDPEWVYFEIILKKGNTDIIHMYSASLWYGEVESLIHGILLLLKETQESFTLNTMEPNFAFRISHPQKGIFNVFTAYFKLSWETTPSENNSLDFVTDAKSLKDFVESLSSEYTILKDSRKN